MRWTLSYTILLLIALLTAGCAAGPLGPPPLPLGPDLEWAAFAVAALAGVFWLTREAHSRYWLRGSGRGNPQAYDILQERYAKGEISREEYLRMASDLGAYQHPPGA